MMAQRQPPDTIENTDPGLVSVGPPLVGSPLDRGGDIDVTFVRDGRPSRSGDTKKKRRVPPHILLEHEREIRRMDAEDERDRRRQRIRSRVAVWSAVMATAVVVALLCGVISAQLGTVLVLIFVAMIAGCIDLKFRARLGTWMKVHVRPDRD